MPQQKDQPPEANEDREDTDGEARSGEESAATDTDTDASAQRVADALGVGETDSAEPDDAAKKDEALPPNRAARRREETLERRRKRKRGAAVAADSSQPTEDDDLDLPKDRNARAKELLKRRREQATERRPVALLPSEMVDDALARSTSAVWKWLRQNFQLLQWIIVGMVAVTGGVLFYLSRAENKAASASAALASATLSERGRVLAEDKRSEDEKEFEVGKVFKTPDERIEQALAAYSQVVDQHPGTGAAIVAKLGQAGMLLEKKDYVQALSAYEAVLATPLAAADPDVKGRTLEGIGFAKEGKGDIDGALAAFKDLGAIDIKGFPELSRYHQARLLLGKGDKDKAKELLVQAQEQIKKAQEPGATGGQALSFLEFVVDDMLRQIDPSAVTARAPIGGPNPGTYSPEDLERILQKLREKAEKKATQADGGTNE